MSKYTGFKNYKNETWKFKKFLLRMSDSCALCSKRFESMDAVTIDHKLALSKGGSNKPDNMQLMCKECNRLKGNL